MCSLFGLSGLWCGIGCGVAVCREVVLVVGGSMVGGRCVWVDFEVVQVWWVVMCGVVVWGVVRCCVGIGCVHFVCAIGARSVVVL